MFTTTQPSRERILDKIHAANCRSFLCMASVFAAGRDWDRAIDALKAAIRAANRAHMSRTAGLSLVAIRRCQDARKRYDAMAPVSEVA